MENEHVISGLLRKRAAIAGELGAALDQVRQLTIDLDSVDSTLRLFQPDIELPEIKAKPLPPRHMAFKGEVTRLILDILREARTGLVSTEIAIRMMRYRGLNSNDTKLMRTVMKRVNAALRHMRKTGRIVSERGPAKLLIWNLPNTEA